jgi:hypothetical protein
MKLETMQWNLLSATSFAAVAWIRPESIFTVLLPFAGVLSSPPPDRHLSRSRDFGWTLVVRLGTLPVKLYFSCPAKAPIIALFQAPAMYDLSECLYAMVLVLPP